MPLSIKNAEAESLARELASLTGEGLTEAVTEALRARLAEVRRGQRRSDLLGDVRAIQEFVRSLPTRDSRTPDELLGYDEFGLPA